MSLFAPGGPFGMLGASGLVRVRAYLRAGGRTVAAHERRLGREARVALLRYRHVAQSAGRRTARIAVSHDIRFFRMAKSESRRRGRLRFE